MICVQDLRRRGRAARLDRHVEQVLGHLVLLGSAPASCRPLTPCTNGARPDRQVRRRNLSGAEAAAPAPRAGARRPLVRSSAVTSKPKPRRKRTFAQVYTAAAASVPSASQRTQHRREHGRRQALRRRDVGRTPRWASHQCGSAGRAPRSARRSSRRRRTSGRPPGTAAPGRAPRPRRPAGERCRRGGSQTATASTSSVTQAVPRGDAAVPGVELVQAGEPLHPAVVGQRPAGPAGVGQGDGQGGGDPGDVALLGEPDVGSLLVRVVDPLDGGTARGHALHSTTRAPNNPPDRTREHREDDGTQR